MSGPSIDGAGTPETPIPPLLPPGATEGSLQAEAPAGAQGVSSIEQAENSEKALVSIFIAAFPELSQPDFYANADDPFAKLTETLQNNAEKVHLVIVGTLDAWLDSIFKEAEISKVKAIEEHQQAEQMLGDQLQQERYEMEMMGAINTAALYLFTSTGFQMLTDPAAFQGSDEGERDLSKAQNYLSLAVHVLGDSEFQQNFRAFALGKAHNVADAAAKEALADKWAAIMSTHIAYTGIGLVMQTDAPEYAGGGSVEALLETTTDENLRRLGEIFLSSREDFFNAGGTKAEWVALLTSIDAEIEGADTNSGAIYHLPSSVFTMVEEAAMDIRSFQSEQQA